MAEYKFSDHTFTDADVKKILQTKEGLQLLQLLSKDGGARLKEAAAALKKGDTAKFQSILNPVIQTREAQTLLEKLDRG